MSDDPNAPHFLSRNLEDDLPDLDHRSLDDEEATAGGSSDYYDEPTTAAPPQDDDGAPDPEPRGEVVDDPTAGQPHERRHSRGRRRLPSHERRPLSPRARARGIACVVVIFNDGRKVVLK